jgi:hypothetical protein
VKYRPHLETELRNKMMDSEKTTKTKKVAYWCDGFWTDPESASLAVQVGAFTADYQIAEFPADADPAFIDTEIAVLLAKQTGQGRN